MPCCYGDDYGSVFDVASARSQARRYRRRGLTGTSAAMVRMITDAGVADATVLEVGAGLGEVLVDLLGRHARHAIAVELAPGWTEAARALARDHGHGERFEGRTGDFVDEAPSLPAVDVVILHRVVCCYPDWRTLLEAAAGRSRRLLALVYPVDRRTTRVAIALANLWFRARGLRFRVFVHPERAMQEFLASARFEIADERSGLVWRTVLLRRAAP